MRRRIVVLVAVFAAVAALTGCGVSGITNTGVVGFGNVPSAASTTHTPVPAGDTEYDVYFQIGDYLAPEPRVTKSGQSAYALYQWLLSQIAQGPNQNELSQGYSQPDEAVSGIQMIQFDPLNKSAAAELNNELTGNDLGQVICTLNGLNTQMEPLNDRFGVVFPSDPTFIYWDDCGSFQLAGGTFAGSVSPSP